MLAEVGSMGYKAPGPPPNHRPINVGEEPFMGVSTRGIKPLCFP